MPQAPIALPDEYVIDLGFRSGDYGGVVEEKITLKRSAGGASLVRVFSTKTEGPKTVERWQPFTVADADRTARAIAYLIDHPWFLNDEKAINRRFWEEQKTTKGKSATAGPIKEEKIKGRETFLLYHPSAYFEMRDGDGTVWWNDDPWSWRGANEDRYNWAAQPVLSSVYPFVVAQFPESQRSGKGKAGWNVVAD